MKMLDLENSYVYFNCGEVNCWRGAIKSTLTNITDNKTYYLTKECRAEIIGQYPFKHQSNSEICIIVKDKDCKYAIRDNPIFKNDDFDNHHYHMVSLKESNDEVILTKTNLIITKMRQDRLITRSSLYNHLLRIQPSLKMK